MIGKLAERFGYTLEVQVLRSNAGWYLGTFDPELGPVSRESGYWRTKEEAEEALLTGAWTQRKNP